MLFESPGFRLTAPGGLSFLLQEEALRAADWRRCLAFLQQKFNCQSSPGALGPCQRPLRDRDLLKVTILFQ